MFEDWPAKHRRRMALDELCWGMGHGSIMDAVRGLIADEVDRRLPWEGPAAAFDAAFAPLVEDARAAEAYLRDIYERNAYAHEGDLAEWFAAPSLGLPELARRGRALIESWRAAWVDLDDEEEDRCEAEEERVRRAEDEGWYGRTHAWEPAMDEWLYLRFGPMPRDGRSRFGLTTGRIEDGPDEWAVATGFRTHESGVSVLRARRHPSAPGAYLLIEPDFERALYGPPEFGAYVQAILPPEPTLAWYEGGAPSPALLVRGHLVTRKARDGILRAELGSDGEYLIDAFRPHKAEPVDMSAVYVDEVTSLPGLLERRDWRRRMAPA